MRDEGKLQEARTLFLLCAAESCPSVISRDCTSWYVETEARLPTVILSAKDASGRDLTDVSVFVDGASAKPLPSAALPLNPGEHVFRFEAPGLAPAESKVLLREGVRRHLVDVVLEPLAVEKEKPTRPVTSASEQRPVPWLSLGLGGVALAGAGTFAYFFTSAADRYDELDRTCAPACDEADVDPARTKLLIAHVALGIGITAAVGAIVTYVLAPKQAATPTEALLSRTIRF